MPWIQLLHTGRTDREVTNALLSVLGRVTSSAASQPLGVFVVRVNPQGCFESASHQSKQVQGTLGNFLGLGKLTPVAGEAEIKIDVLMQQLPR